VNFNPQDSTLTDDENNVIANAPPLFVESCGNVFKSLVENMSYEAHEINSC
jgi:hypothetical protein